MLNEIDLSRTDLNLLLLFEVVLAERHVGRAAGRLSLSPSAVSHGLGRLRRLLNDPLFLRTPRGVEPTTRALELAQPIADALLRAIRANPNEIFLIEGHTDAVGSDIDNLSLSDRRAEAIAIVLTDRYGVPAENLTTQGYGEQFLKVQTSGPERENRRAAVRRITPLLTGGGAPPRG